MKNQTKKIGTFITITIISFIVSIQISAVLAIATLFIAALVAGIWENQTICHSSNQTDHSTYFLQN